MSEYLNIYDINERGSRVLGPGLRFILWVQGCLFNCLECCSPESNSIHVHNIIPIEKIASSIINNKSINGITISGGEPFLQAENVATLLQKVLSIRPELDVICFTGFKKDDLDWPAAQLLLSRIDLLIDGKYKKKYDNDKGLRGSSNQVLHFLTSRLQIYKEELLNGVRHHEIHISRNRTVVHGIPSKHNYII